MKGASFILTGLLALSLIIYASAAISGSADEAEIEAQASVALASATLDQAVARENQARVSLDRATQAAAKKPKSKKAKKALEKALENAKKELAAASRNREKAAAALKEETAAQAAAARREPPPPPPAIPPGTAKTSAGAAKFYADLFAFTRDGDTAEKIDPFSFFMDPLPNKGKSVALDAKFDHMIQPGEGEFVIWRNFGHMPLIVSNLPETKTIPPAQDVLLFGTITDFKNELIGDELVLHTMIRAKGVFFCVNNLCPKYGMQKVN